MVRQWQTLFYDGRYSNTDLQQGSQPKNRPAGTRIPDFVKLAEAYGCEGIRCEETGQVDKVIEQAMAIDDRPVVIDFVVHKDAMVWPMVAAGASNNDIKFARDLAPDWGGSEE
jgi:acetolactate synthase I/II/III large subunit